MSQGKFEVKNLVQCPKCKMRELELRETLGIEALEEIDLRWKVSGKAEIVICGHGRCRNCGYIPKAIEKEVLILYPTLECPICGSREHLVCHFRGQVKEGEFFEFKAVVSCEYVGCRFKSQFTRAINSLLKVVSIEIGLTGLKLKKEEEKNAT